MTCPLKISHFQVKHGAPLLMETEIYNDMSSEIDEKVRSYLTQPFSRQLTQTFSPQKLDEILIRLCHTAAMLNLRHEF